MEGYLWHVRYPIVDDAGEPTDDYVLIATTRPETIVADVAIAVNPSVERWERGVFFTHVGLVRRALALEFGEDVFRDYVIGKTDAEGDTSE